MQLYEIDIWSQDITRENGKKWSLYSKYREDELDKMKEGIVYLLSRGHTIKIFQIN